jgi:hypothetical protein
MLVMSFNFKLLRDINKIKSGEKNENNKEF